MKRHLRTFDPIGRLRRIRDEEAPGASPIRLAMTRISKTEDGRVFLEWLWERAYGRPLLLDAPESALREMAAAQRLFDQINGLVEDTRDDSGGRNERRPTGG